MSRMRTCLLALPLTFPLATSGWGQDVRVSAGGPPSPFAQNKQNEPWVAIDPSAPSTVVAGANDEIDVEACNAGDPTTCPFTPGVGTSGVYISLNGGTTWSQPTYQGLSARACLGPAACAPTGGPIGTLPGYDAKGIISDGDPAIAFGPLRGADGKFAWSNGSRLYYANLTSNLAETKQEQSFKGFEAIAVSRADNVQDGLVAGDWLAPAIISRQNGALFSDKEAIWADNAASSPYFGHVYICNVAFRSAAPAEHAQPVILAVSKDGGDSWTQRQISQAANAGGPGRSGGRQGCVVSGDSIGTVYVAWEGSFKGREVVWLTRSRNGGGVFERPRAVVEIGSFFGQFDEVSGDVTFDGIAGARTSPFPSLAVANGAPTGAGATDLVVLAWPNGSLGPNQERVLVSLSNDRGLTWSTPVNATQAGDRPNFPWVAISPDGADLYLVYNAFLQGWQSTTANPRPMQGVVRHAESASPSVWTTLHRGPVGDARGSSANALTSEFLGDYNYVAATNDSAVAVWNDTRNALDCPAIDAYRQSLADGTPIARPAPQVACPAQFGNTDIYGGAFPDPTP